MDFQSSNKRTHKSSPLFFPNVVALRKKRRGGTIRARTIDIMKKQFRMIERTISAIAGKGSRIKSGNAVSENFNGSCPSGLVCKMYFLNV